jgi:tetratricopeptide (TPR) repeat protein
VSVRWCIGSTLAQNTSDPDLAVLAVRYTPADPQTHFTLGKITESSLSENDLRTAVSEYKLAATLAPNDYRLWMILAAAEERTGDLSGAEAAYQRARTLAPDYSIPEWAAGNFMLRHGNADRAFELLFEAAESMERLRRPVLELADSYNQGELGGPLSRMGPRRELEKALVQFRIDRHDAEGALFTWAALTPDERAEARTTGVNLISALFTSHHYLGALSVTNELAGNQQFVPNQIDDGGFETNVETGGDNLFGWRVGAGAQPQIALDGAQRRTGNNSLTLVFDANGGTPLREVSQLVVVAPGKSFHLSYSLRSADLNGSATFQIEILNAVDQTVLARSTAVPAGTADWREESIEFTTPIHSEAIVIKIDAVPCALEVCPLFGRIWYDDFELKRVETATGPQN